MQQHYGACHQESDENDDTPRSHWLEFTSSKETMTFVGQKKHGAANTTDPDLAFLFERKRSPEENMYLASLYQGVYNALRPKESYKRRIMEKDQDSSIVRFIQEDRNWILSENTIQGSFIWMCDLLDISAQTIAQIKQAVLEREQDSNTDSGDFPRRSRKNTYSIATTTHII